MYYVSLPYFFKNFLIIHSDIEKKISFVDRHWFEVFSINEFITSEGINWFKQNNIFIRDTVLLFAAPKFLNGRIHSDVGAGAYAFNFVLHGKGSMQWTASDGEVFTNNIKHNNGNLVSFPAIKNPKKVFVLDEWDGDMALVKINNFHRIMTYDDIRICLTLRPDPTKNQSFEEISSILSDIFDNKV